MGTRRNLQKPAIQDAAGSRARVLVAKPDRPA